jgi:hypothetical protein
MSTRLAKYQSDFNAWPANNNYHNASKEYMQFTLNGSNPPTLARFSRFNFYATDTANIPAGTPTGNNEYGAGDAITYLVNEAIYEDAAARTFTWSSGNFPVQSDGTWYLYCDGSTDTDETTIGKGKYGASKTETPTFSFQKGGWYSANGYRVLCEFTSTGGTIVIVRTFYDGVVRFSAGNIAIRNNSQDDNILFQVNDGGSIVTSMTMDGSEGALVKIGTSDTNDNAELKVTGNLTGAEGGQISLELSGAYDTTYDRYIIDAFEDDLRLRREGITNDIVLKNDGKVGIGTSTPGAKLDIAGALIFSADVGYTTKEIIRKNNNFLIMNGGTGGYIFANDDNSNNDVLINASGLMTVNNGIATKNSTANVSNPPTDAELDSAFGAPATVGAGFIGTLDDAGGGANFYLVASDGSNWWHFTGTKAT